MKSRRAALAAILALVACCFAFAATAAEPREGMDFRAVTPPLAAPAGRIEVIEFFWYGCPHCYDFEPVLAAWVARLPADVSFRRVPAIASSPSWIAAARMYYTLEALGLGDMLHGDVFTAIHRERLRLHDEAAVADWAARKGIDPKRFAEAWASPAVQARIEQAGELTRAARLSGVPALMVQGRYLTLAQGDTEDLIAVLDYLVARARKDAALR